MTRDEKKGRKDLRLVKPDERVEPRELDEATDALRTAVAPAELDALDNEALLALALGDDVSEIAQGEHDAAEALRFAMDGDGEHPLAELAGALRAAHAAADIAAEDNEALIALGIATDVAVTEDTEALRHALDGNGTHGLASLAGSLRAAAGDEIDASDHEVLIALAVDEGVAELPRIGELSHTSLTQMLRATVGQPALSETDNGLLVALTTGVEDHLPEAETELPADLVAVADSLRAASGQLPGIEELKNERLLRNALEAAVGRATETLVAGDRPEGEVVRLASRSQSGALIGAIVALAAGFALFFGSLKWLETRQGGPTASTTVTAVNAELVHTRSTTELFDPLEKFPATGGESERMQKIVSSRAADLRKNRFAQWGVK